MREHQNTLFVTTQGAYLAREDEAVLVKVERETKLRVPVHTISGIVCFGQVNCSPPLMELCSERGVAISFLTEQGRFLSRVEGPLSGNVLLRREQYRRADDPAASARVAWAIVAAKIANSRRVLQRALRDRPEMAGREDVARAVRWLRQRLTSLHLEDDIDVIRGLEGDSARIYFGVFDHLISAQNADFCFCGRTRRPPLDNVNALLSFVYALVEHDMRSALQGVGLDPCVGYLHRDRPGRPGLSLDLMEEFRAFVADRLVLSLINLQRVKGTGFVKVESGGVNMIDHTRKLVIGAYQTRKRDEIVHPFLGERMTVGMVMHIQARLLARYLRGDTDGYPPFMWK